MGKRNVITLCGSTRFKAQFLGEQKRLTLAGNVVLSVGVFGHLGDKKMLDEIHRAKIDLSDQIHVINVGGYIGESTKSEIEYAEKTGKKITYFEPIIL